MMFRILRLCAFLGSSLLAPAAIADIALFPQGFADSVAFDPASGRPVQVISGGKAGAPTVVLIHGLGQQASKDWLPVLPVLAQHYQVLIFDLPGFGRSDRPDTALSPKMYADLVHWLIAGHSKEPVFVVGHSLGAAIALRHSHDYPDQVKRLLLVDAAGILQTTVFARHLSRVPDQVQGPKLLQGLVKRGSRVLNRVSGHIQDLTAESASPLAAMAGSDVARGLLYKDSSNVNAALALVNEDFSPVIRNIKVPVWILWGELDPVAPLRTGQALKWLLPEAKLEVLPQVGHVPMRDATEATVAWLLNALQAPMAPAEAVDYGASQGDGVCRNQKNRVFRGKWRTIRLEHCSDVRIEHAALEQLVVNRSTVTIDNVSIQSKGTALEAKDASITATGLRIVAQRAMSLDNTRLDLAAVQVFASELGHDKDDSLIFMSLGHWCDGAAQWRLHDVWKPRKGGLDPQFRKQGAGACSLPKLL